MQNDEKGGEERVPCEFRREKAENKNYTQNYTSDHTCSPFLLATYESGAEAEGPV